MNVPENTLFHFLKDLRAKVYAAQREGRELDRQAAQEQIDALTPAPTVFIFDYTREYEDRNDMLRGRFIRNFDRMRDGTIEDPS